MQWRKSIKEEKKDKKLSGQPRALSNFQNRIIATQRKKSSCQIKTYLFKPFGIIYIIQNIKNPGLISNHLQDKIQIGPDAIWAHRVAEDKKNFNPTSILQHPVKVYKKKKIKNIFKEKENVLNEYKNITSESKTEYNKNIKVDNINL